MTLILLIFFTSIFLSSPLTATNLPNSRIIGGSEANSGQFPFLAAIHVHTPSRAFFCAGTIFTSTWIATAGHCVQNATLFTIYMGSTKLESHDPNRIVATTSKYVIHPNFISESLDHDIGLIELHLPITFNDYVNHIVYLPGSASIDFSPAFAVGWGQTSNTQPGPVNELHVTQVAVMTNEECKTTYGAQIKASMMCVAGNSNEGICSGDSGGPLLQPVGGNHGDYRMLGIASFYSNRGCETNDPSGYTRLYPHLAWIIEMTKMLDDSKIL